MIDDFNLTGRRAIVTGGYGHLGRAICHALQGAGASVFVAGRTRSKFEQAFAPQAHAFEFVSMDLAHNDSVEQALNAVGIQGLDILVNNGFFLAQAVSLAPSATQFDFAGLSDPGLCRWQGGMEGALSSVFRCCHYALPYLRQSNQARIINIASIYGLVAPNPEMYDDFLEHTNQVSYGVAKAGVLQLTRYLASFLAADGICVNALSPGPFLTETTKKNHRFHQRICDAVPLGRSGSPEELAGAVLLLASKASSYITGQNLVVDGGWTIR